MGGRGASSGISAKGKRYGTEYTTLLTKGNIKFIKYNDSKSAKTPMETMTNGRIYVTIGRDGKPKAINTYDEAGKRNKQIDISGKPHKIGGEYTLPHVHIGYLHDEGGTIKITTDDKKLIDRVLKEWDNHKRKEAV